MIDELLQKFGLTSKDLKPNEQETLNVWLAEYQKGQMTVERVREHIASMKNAVEAEIGNAPTFIRIFIFKVENPDLIRLQARLRNYLLLEAFLSTPERAKQQMENAIAAMVGKRVI